jgi:arginyl-tRNA synthetase
MLRVSRPCFHVRFLPWSSAYRYERCSAEHHSFHIAIIATILGESLARIVEFAGFETIRASYPGDLGLGVITVVWAYDRFYRGKEPENIHDRGQWLLNIYVEATRLLEPKENETSEEKTQREAYSERRECIENGMPSKFASVAETRQWSLEELNDILALVDVKIEVWFFESDVDEPAKKIVDELIERGIATDERAEGGPVIVKIDEKLGLKKEKYRTAVILRSDNTSLYLTKDLALAKVKFDEYHVDRSIYVVDNRQSLHFQQAFKILELWDSLRLRNVSTWLMDLSACRKEPCPPGVEGWSCSRMSLTKPKPAPWQRWGSGPLTCPKISAR